MRTRSDAEDDIRPRFHVDMSAEEFARWYWPKNDLETICEMLALPKGGNKAALRERIEFRLANPNTPIPKPKPEQKSGFKWGSADLTRHVIITSSITFGPNVRRFFQREIGSNFVCYSDFMDWVRGNEGATLGDAIDAWWALERRKDDPTFRREIADHNNFLQYLRDFQDAYPERSLHDAKACWDQKKIRPAKEGKVVFERRDVRFL